MAASGGLAGILLPKETAGAQLEADVPDSGYSDESVPLGSATHSRTQALEFDAGGLGDIDVSVSRSY